MSKLHQSGGLSVFARQNSMGILKEETRAWRRLYCAENSWPEISARRWLQIEDELERTGTYWQSAEELEYGAKVAWRKQYSLYRAASLAESCGSRLSGSAFS